MKRPATASILSVAVVTLACAPSFAQSGAVQHVLDVGGAPTTPAPAESSPSIDLLLKRQARPPLGRSSHERRETRAQLTISLVSVDRITYDTGDPIGFEAVVENVGTKPVAIPWSPDFVGVAEEAAASPSLRLGSLFLAVHRAGAVDRIDWLAPQTLVGASEVPNSLVQLMPGEKALMRARNYWRPGEDALKEILAATQATGHVEVYAVLSLNEEGLLVKSKNSLDVSVRLILR